MAYRRPFVPNAPGLVNMHRIGWARTLIGMFEVRQYLPEARKDATTRDGQLLSDLQLGPNIRLSFTVPNSSKLHSFDLTNCTERELDAIEKIFQLAIDLARPVVQHRDEAAHEAYEAGDDSNTRVYRQPPELVVRNGKIATYSQGVLHRPEDVPRRPGRPEPSGDRGGAGGTGDGVADEAPSDAGPEDDGPETDQP